MIRLEKSLDECLESLKRRWQDLGPEPDMSETDDLDSITSNSVSGHSVGLRSRVVRFGSNGRELERLKSRLARAEKDNISLRQQIVDLKRQLGQETSSEEKKLDEQEKDRVELSEGGVWGLVKKLKFTDHGDSTKLLTNHGSSKTD